jgi:hypothetical protein
MNDVRLLRISDHKRTNLDQVCSIQVRGDVIDFHLAVTRGYEPAIVSASGEWARKIIAMLESRPQPDIVVEEQP